MKIEVWSDFVCPFCYIGKRKLEQALENFQNKDDVEIEFKSFQLDPNAAPYNGQDYYESLSAKFGSVEQVKQMTKNVGEQAKLVGLDYQFDKMKSTNTFKAHRLAHYAKKYGKANELTEALLHAHFTEGLDVNNNETLTNIAKDVGLEATEVAEVLSIETAYGDNVNADIQEAQQLQITGVPFFVFNRKYAVSGAQPNEIFTQTLEKAWAKEI